MCRSSVIDLYKPTDPAYLLLSVCTDAEDDLRSDTDNTFQRHFFCVISRCKLINVNLHVNATTRPCVVLYDVSW